MTYTVADHMKKEKADRDRWAKENAENAARVRKEREEYEGKKRAMLSHKPVRPTFTLPEGVDIRSIDRTTKAGEAEYEKHRRAYFNHNRR